MIFPTEPENFQRFNRFVMSSTFSSFLAPYNNIFCKIANLLFFATFERSFNVDAKKIIPMNVLEWQLSSFYEAQMNVSN